jgi:C-terminal processing protease CtpA/Prc
MKANKKFSRSVSPTLSIAAVLCLLALSGNWSPARSQSLSSIDRERGRAMVGIVKDEIKKSYYDPTYHGLDLDARFKAAEEKIKQATSLGQVFGIIAQAVTELNDSHTFFIPPARAARADYGWQMQMIGDQGYVIAVKPESDADAQGLKPGDLLLSVDGFKPSRDNMWKMGYRYYTLRPQPGIQVEVQTPDGQQRKLDLKARITQLKRRLDFSGDGGATDILNFIRELEDEGRFHRHRYYDEIPEAFIWKMPQFDLSSDEIDRMMGRVKKHPALILDLRGNGGGSEITMQRLIGSLIDHDVKVGDLKRRKETKPLTARTRGSEAYKGKLVVLVDSASGSASEVFARVMQLEKRGTVIGDQTAGHVMRSDGHVFDMGTDVLITYAISITDADLIMTDGKSLEHLGVTPDQMMLPTAADLAAKRDPVLAAAAELAGFKLGAEKAGTLFPIEWKK